jgi:hypothetical protein
MPLSGSVHTFPRCKRQKGNSACRSSSF